MIGFLLIDKHDGPTSHDVVDAVRRLTGERRVGHAGTLDPFATGLLIVGVAREATREFPKLVGLDKEYEATFVLGASSDTDDRTGKITDETNIPTFSAADVKQTMEKFTGEIEQMPPAYSAIKVGGRKSYEAARQGETLELKPRRVTVHAFELLDPPAASHPPQIVFRVRIRCSSGTYIRALARDLGKAMGTGGYVAELRRTAIGPFRVEEAHTLPSLNTKTVQSRLVPVEGLLGQLAS